MGDLITGNFGKGAGTATRAVGRAPAGNPFKAPSLTKMIAVNVVAPRVAGGAAAHIDGRHKSKKYNKKRANQALGAGLGVAALGGGVGYMQMKHGHIDKGLQTIIHSGRASGAALGAQSVYLAHSVRQPKRKPKANTHAKQKFGGRAKKK